MYVLILTRVHTHVNIHIHGHTHSHTHTHTHTRMDCIHICTWIGIRIAVADLLDEFEGH